MEGCRVYRAPQKSLPPPCLKEKYYIEPMQRKQGNWMEGKTFLPTFGTLLKVGPGKDRHKHLRGQEGGAGPKIPVGLAGRKEVIGP